MSSHLLLRSLACWTYPFAKRLLFSLDPERAHDWTLGALASFQKMSGGRCLSPDFGPAEGEVSLMGLTFPNRLGLAAGLDKGAYCVDALGSLGFGHLEVGTVTPRPQPGNPKPRLFRLVSSEALINRMGFNNPGVEDAVARLAKRRYPGVVGVNIGKNFSTSLEAAQSDYVEAFRSVYAQADYVTINLSSPNTKNLRNLQSVDHCRPLLRILMQQRRELADRHEKMVPIAIKIAPDLTDQELDAMADLFVGEGVDAVVATNTTVSRDGLGREKHAQEPGGLSGRPLAQRSTEVIARLSQRLRNHLPIIGVGGIFSGEDALEKLQAGASLIQIYTGFVYRGPALVNEILNTIRTSETCSSEGSLP